MKLTAEPTRVIDEGKHNGTLIKCEENTRGEYKYMDMWFKILGDGVDRTIKTGVPSRIEKNSTLGRIIESTGLAVIVGEEYDLEEILVGKTFSFLVTDEPGTGKHAGKTFKKIIPDTIKGVNQDE